jgi:hypothetical protein
MSLPFSTPDLEDGFAPTTPFRNRFFDRTSGSSSAFNWNPETTLPPPKDKGNGQASQIQDITEEDTQIGRKIFKTFWHWTTHNFNWKRKSETLT